MSIWIPSDCPGGRSDCEALATIKSDCGKSFVCSGLNDGSTRKLNQDRFTFCFKNDQTDEMTHNDEQDMRDMLSVIAQTLSADWHIKQDTALTEESSVSGYEKLTVRSENDG